MADDRNIDNLRNMPHDPSGPLENQPQIDPMLQEGQASGFRMWAIGLGIAVVLALVIYGVGSHSTQNAANNPSDPAAAPGAQAQPPAIPPGRGDSAAPMTPNVRTPAPPSSPAQ